MDAESTLAYSDLHTLLDLYLDMAAVEHLLLCIRFTLFFIWLALFPFLLVPIMKYMYRQRFGVVCKQFNYN